MSIADLNLIFETEEAAFYLRQSNKNKYYYKGLKTGSRISKLQRVKSNEFWEEFSKNKNPVFEEASKDVQTRKHTIEEPKPEKPETLVFEPEEAQTEDLEELEEIQEEPKKSIFDRSFI